MDRRRRIKDVLVRVKGRLPFDRAGRARRGERKRVFERIKRGGSDSVERSHRGRRGESRCGDGHGVEKRWWLW